MTDCFILLLVVPEFLHPYELWFLQGTPVLCEVWLLFTKLGWLFTIVADTSMCQLILFFKNISAHLSDMSNTVQVYGSTALCWNLLES